jgi:alpha 1,2-mannosyltransferase
VIIRFCSRFRDERLLTEVFHRPGVNFFCDIDEDPFLFMERNNKTYSFTISMEEFVDTIPSLWSTVKGEFLDSSSSERMTFNSSASVLPEFVKENPQFVAENNAMGFISDDGGKEYNLCHCSSPLHPPLPYPC